MSQHLFLIFYLGLWTKLLGGSARATVVALPISFIPGNYVWAILIITLLFPTSSDRFIRVWYVAALVKLYPVSEVQRLCFWTSAPASIFEEEYFPRRSFPGHAWYIFDDSYYLDYHLGCCYNYYVCNSPPRYIWPASGNMCVYDNNLNNIHQKNDSDYVTDTLVNSLLS